MVTALVIRNRSKWTRAVNRKFVIGLLQDLHDGICDGYRGLKVIFQLYDPLFPEANVADKMDSFDGMIVVSAVVEGYQRGKGGMLGGKWCALGTASYCRGGVPWVLQWLCRRALLRYEDATTRRPTGLRYLTASGSHLENYVVMSL
jgi:hypothetical protein